MAGGVTFAGGALLGLASSLHCVGMCGGIALLLGVPPGREARAPAWLATLLPHAGRAFAYVLLGGIVGALGGAVFGIMALASAHLLLRWAAAMTLVWIGLATLGLMPSPAAIGHAILPRVGSATRIQMSVSPAGRLLAGLGWGLMPCGMVYGALLYAAFAGSAPGGMAVMAGFALGTLPSLLFVQGGAGMLAQFARRREARLLTGLAIIVVALASLLPGEDGLLAACGKITHVL